MNIGEMLKVRTLFVQIKDEPSLSTKIRYNIARFLYKTDADLTFYQETFRKIVDEYSEKDENGEPVAAETGDNSVKIYQTKIDECMAAMKELETTEIEDWHFSFTEDEILKTNLPVDKIYLLMPYITE